MDRRQILSGASACAVAGVIAPSWALAATDDWLAMPPVGSFEEFSAWSLKFHAADPAFLKDRYERYKVIVANKDVKDDRNKRAFLATPREEFVLKQNLDRAYESAFLDIGFGVTISGPHLVARMTTSIDVQEGQKVLEIGTGSGYQSAYLSNLTDKVYTIEIVKPLAERTRKTYDALIARGFKEYANITTKNADGYYGWEEFAPFDKIIVTCGIDHIPPPLLQQLKPNGIIVIPVGPPGAQHVLKVVKEQGADGAFNITRSDIYNGRIVPFVPFKKLVGDEIKGAHDGDAK